MPKPKYQARVAQRRTLKSSFSCLHSLSCLLLLISLVKASCCTWWPHVALSDPTVPLLTNNQRKVQSSLSFPSPRIIKQWHIEYMVYPLCINMTCKTERRSNKLKSITREYEVYCATFNIKILKAFMLMEGNLIVYDESNYNLMWRVFVKLCIVIARYLLDKERRLKPASNQLLPRFIYISQCFGESIVLLFIILGV